MTRFAAAIALVLAATSIAPLGSDAAATPSSPACSRERSRAKRDVLDEFFHPVVARNDFVLPPNCPFGRDKDMYLEHERHKEVVRRTQYKSLYSDKVFKSEYYVDKHIGHDLRPGPLLAPTIWSPTTATCFVATSTASGSVRMAAAVSV